MWNGISPCNYFVIGLSQSIHFLWCDHLAWVFNRSLAGHFDLSPDKLLGSLRKHAIVLPMCAAQGGLKGQMENELRKLSGVKRIHPMSKFRGSDNNTKESFCSHSLGWFFWHFCPLHHFCILFCTADYHSLRVLACLDTILCWSNMFDSMYNSTVHMSSLFSTLIGKRPILRSVRGWELLHGLHGGYRRQGWWNRDPGDHLLKNTCGWIRPRPLRSGRAWMRLRRASSRWRSPFRPRGDPLGAELTGRLSEVSWVLDMGLGRWNAPEKCSVEVFVDIWAIEASKNREFVLCLSTPPT